MAEDKLRISFRQRFKNTTTKLNNSKSFNGMMGMANSVLSAIPSNNLPKNENDAIGSSIRGAASDALMSGVAGPWGMAAGAAMKIMDKTGGFSAASKGLGGKNDTLNTIASFAIPGSGWFAKKTDKFKVSDDLASSSGFTGTAKNAKTVQGNANAKILFGRGKANRQIAQMKETQGTIGNILNNNKDLMASQADNAQDIANSYDFNKMGGWGANTMQFGRSGLKLKDKELIKRISRKRRLKEVASFKEGGKIGRLSVIPGGALHARKHKLGEYDENLAGQVTHKGVPVVSFEFGGEIELHAEIERGEIIFRKEITDMIEALKKDGSDEAAILAGKIIAEEIINNTIDNSGEYEIENKEQDVHGKKGNK